MIETSLGTVCLGIRRGSTTDRSISATSVSVGINQSSRLSNVTEVLSLKSMC